MTEEQKKEPCGKRVWDGLWEIGFLLLFLIALYLMSHSCGAE